MIAYETRRANFEKIVQMYKDYLRLYRFFNHGSIEGASDFQGFYWTYHYYYIHTKENSLTDGQGM